MGLRRLIRLAASLATVALGASGALAPLDAQEVGASRSWAVASERLAADLTAGDRSASVRVDFVLTGGEPGAPITLQLLGFDVATAADVIVDDVSRHVLWPASGSLSAATITAPSATEGGDLAFVVEYRIALAVAENGGALTGRVPVLTAALPIAEEAGDVFEAVLRLPGGWAVTDGFPTGLRSDGEDAYRVSLAAVPSVLSFRARSDGTWRPGLPLLMDLLTVLVLLGFTVVGWRHLRGLAA